MTEMLANPEPLHPDLQPYLFSDDRFGPYLKHPLVFSIPHMEAINPLVNRQYIGKLAAVERATEDGDWELIVSLHERPFRVDAFIEVCGMMTDADYWSTLAWLWRDSENIREFPEAWHGLWASDRPGREQSMSEEEREALAAMPDEITVYQGHTSERDDGWSWTTELRVAEWFANRFALLEGDTPMVSTGVVSKAEVIAYFTARSESEIVVDRAAVRDIRSNVI